MWRQYKKNFVGMQLVICCVTLLAYTSIARVWELSVLIFLTMQLAAFVGAAWANRLRKKIAGHAALEAGATGVVVQ